MLQVILVLHALSVKCYPGIISGWLWISLVSQIQTLSIHSLEDKVPIHFHVTSAWGGVLMAKGLHTLCATWTTGSLQIRMRVRLRRFPLLTKFKKTKKRNNKPIDSYLHMPQDPHYTWNRMLGMWGKIHQSI